jgi:hypothetical protein
MVGKCGICGNKMEEGTSCIESQKILFSDGKEMTPVKVGHGKDWTELTCNDCNAPEDGYHHPGCDMERCPRCRGQLITCDCTEKRIVL